MVMLKEKMGIKTKVPVVAAKEWKIKLIAYFDLSWKNKTLKLT